MSPLLVLPAMDGLLATSARDLTIATRNVADFTRSGVPVENPFEFAG